MREGPDPAGEQLSHGGAKFSMSESGLLVPEHESGQSSEAPESAEVTPEPADTEPETEASDGRIEDISKAEEMAYAAKDNMDKYVGLKERAPELAEAEKELANAKAEEVQAAYEKVEQAHETMRHNLESKGHLQAADNMKAEAEKAARRAATEVSDKQHQTFLKTEAEKREYESKLSGFSTKLSAGVNSKDALVRMEGIDPKKAEEAKNLAEDLRAVLELSDYPFAVKESRKADEHYYKSSVPGMENVVIVERRDHKTGNVISINAIIAEETTQPATLLNRLRQGRGFNSEGELPSSRVLEQVGKIRTRDQHASTGKEGVYDKQPENAERKLSTTEAVMGFGRGIDAHGNVGGGNMPNFLNKKRGLRSFAFWFFGI